MMYAVLMLPLTVTESVSPGKLRTRPDRSRGTAAQHPCAPRPPHSAQAVTRAYMTKYEPTNALIRTSMTQVGSWRMNQVT